MAKPLFGDSPEPSPGPEERKAKPLFGDTGEARPPVEGTASPRRLEFSDPPPSPPKPPGPAPLAFDASPTTAAPTTPAPAGPTPLAFSAAPPGPALPTSPSGAAPLAFPSTPGPASPPPAASLFAPGSAGAAPPPKPVSKEVTPQPVFMDAEQTWLSKLDQAARRLYPDTDSAAHARMLIGWRALLPYSEKAVMMLGDRELKAAALLASRQANAARILAQSPVPNLLERLSKALGGGAKRSWFGTKKPEDPSRIVTDLQAQEPAIQKAFDDNCEAREHTQRLHDDLEAYYQAAQCMLEVGEDTWKASLESRRQLLHQAVYNLELTLAHLQQQERLLLQWREDIQRLVYLIYPTWQMGQQS